MKEHAMQSSHGLDELVLGWNKKKISSREKTFLPHFQKEPSRANYSDKYNYFKLAAILSCLAQHWSNF